MAVSFLEIGQFISIILAAGTPGMTYYVMGRMHKTQITNMESNCKKCRENIDEKFECLGESLGEVETRQKDLRETDLPEKYVKRRDLEALEKKHEKEIDIVHKRIDRYHPVP
jgi:hypothetical protein